ncbi:AAA family ATPase [Cohnella cholangitidis]|uniref:ATP-binding protein n=1 Tax=Cohnella cholangitidis TaxID=2598458 RepID=A0A7G5BW79_9BACL|nr:AAA family ATPase [Cohnella cholangitidis]QMV41213.1 ATP-binding protein [Cohnella cholangitidis]
MPKLIFVVGGAGAGKTTLTKAIAGKRGAPMLDMDTLLRPAAIALMTLAGLDPNDRDSSEYKKLCRDLGYRITMDAALENVAIGTDVFVVGPFTKETENPRWIKEELLKIGVSAETVEVKVIVVHLAGLEVYRERIGQRGTELDRWKLEHWAEFSRSLAMRVPKWDLPEESVLYFDNSQPLNEERLAVIKRFVYGTSR